MRNFFALALLFIVPVNSAVANETVNYYQSQLIKSDNYQFFAYASPRSSGIEVKVRFQSSDVRANIATGNIGFSFDTSEGMFYLNETETALLLKIKQNLPDMLKQAKSIREDNYENRFELSADTKLVFSYSKVNDHTKIFLHAKMASSDSPFAKMGEGLIELSTESFLSMINAVEGVYTKAQNH